MQMTLNQRKSTSTAVVDIGCLQGGWWPEVGLVAREWTVFCPSGGGGEPALGTSWRTVAAPMASPRFGTHSGRLVELHCAAARGSLPP